MTNTPFRQKLLVDFRNKLKSKLSTPGYGTVEGVLVYEGKSVINPRICTDYLKTIEVYQLAYRNFTPDEFLTYMYPLYLIRLHHPEYLL
jgi:hypothetical protein